MGKSSGHTGPALPAAYFSTETSSFVDFLRMQAPDLLPGHRDLDVHTANGLTSSGLEPAHGTTIVALTFNGGVLIAGDRRATSGNLIANRDVDKIYISDDYSAVGIAGSVGIALELVRLYTVELAHYEKLEGVPLSLDGKANKLATMVKGNLDMAMAGLAALPLFIGYDTEATDPNQVGRIVSYDVTGARQDERGGYYAIGSGSLFAKSAIKKLYQPGLDQDAAIRIAIEALYDAADDDTATGGPDMVRRIFPTLVTITGEAGAMQVPTDQAAAVAEAVVQSRAEQATPRE